MRPASPLPRVLALVLSTLAWLSAATASSTPQPLSLVGTVDRASGRLVAVDDGNLILEADGSRMPVTAPGASWQLTGDIRSHARHLRWSPSYALSRDPRYPADRYVARVSLRHHIDLAPPVADIADLTIRDVARAFERVRDPLTEDWPGSHEQPGAVVAVWIVDGRVLATQVRPLPETGRGREFAIQFEFSLLGDQARGQPALLLWQGGSFVVPTPFSKHMPTQEAYHAVFFDDVQALRAAQEAGARLDAESPHDATTLAHFAAECGASASLDVLLAARPRLAEAMTTYGASPLTWAAGRGRLEPVVKLLARAADERKSGTQVSAALAAAIASGHTAIAERLFPELTRPSSRDAATFQGMATAAWTGGYPEMCTLLLRHDPKASPGDPAARSRNLFPQLLNLHVRQGNAPMVRYLLGTEGVDPEVAYHGEKPLVAAARTGHDSIVQLLLEAGVDPEGRADGGTTPLMAAAKGDNPAIVARLLAAGAHPNSANKEGMTALHFAAERDNGAIVSLLLDHGADAQLCTIREITPLDLALFVGATESVRLLTERGACIGLGATYTQDLLLAAITHDIAPAVATAIEQGWPSHSTFSGVWPALRVAEVLGADACAEVLRRAGATSHPDRPMPVADAAGLDAPIQVLSSPPFRDPRDPDEEFPAARIRIRMLIDGQGRPNFPRMLDRCDPRVRLALLKTAQQMRFSAPLRAGQPVAAFVTHEFRLAASDERVFDESEIDSAVRVTSEQRPYLPRSASRKDRNARVVLAFVVNVFGRAEQVEVTETSGPAYTDSAMVALSQWRFVPGKCRSTPVPVRRTQIFSFDPKTR